MHSIWMMLQTLTLDCYFFEHHKARYEHHHVLCYICVNVIALDLEALMSSCYFCHGAVAYRYSAVAIVRTGVAQGSWQRKSRKTIKI